MITSGEGEWGAAQMWIGDLEVQMTMYTINKLQGYSIQHREYSQYCITLNGV